MSNNLEPITVNASEAARLLGVTPAVLCQWRHKGVGPKYIKSCDSSKGRVLYPYKALIDWVDEREKRFQSE